MKKLYFLLVVIILSLSASAQGDTTRIIDVVRANLITDGTLELYDLKRFTGECVTIELIDMSTGRTTSQRSFNDTEVIDVSRLAGYFLVHTFARSKSVYDCALDKVLILKPD